MLEPQLPVRHEWLVRERDHGKLALEPFEPGFALAAATRTAGSYSPRSWVGADLGQDRETSCTSSRTSGVTEDTLDIMLNLRKVVFSLH